MPAGRFGVRATTEPLETTSISAIIRSNFKTEKMVRDRGFEPLTPTVSR